MSALNGDKARFNRERKQRIARRTRTRELVQKATQPNKTENPSRSKSRTVSV